MKRILDQINLIIIAFLTDAMLIFIILRTQGNHHMNVFYLYKYNGIESFHNLIILKRTMIIIIDFIVLIVLKYLFCYFFFS